MPPRYAFWTILIDGKATAFRAREKEELLPTFQQLKRTNKDVVFKWFARGRLWETPEESQAALRAPRVVPEKRGGAWRPGGTHADPRERFKKKSGARSHKFDSRPKPPDAAQGFRPASPRPPNKYGSRPSGPSRGDRSWGGKPPSSGPRQPQPWRDKPSGPPRGDRPWSRKPSGGAPPRGDRPWRDKKFGTQPPPKPRPEPVPEPPPTPEANKIKPDHE
jgi:hypothetical protein